MFAIVLYAHTHTQTTRCYSDIYVVIVFGTIASWWPSLALARSFVSFGRSRSGQANAHAVLWPALRHASHAGDQAYGRMDGWTDVGRAQC